MRCYAFEDSLDAYIDGELDENATREMAKHETECTACGQLAADARAISDLLAQMGEEEPPEDLHARLMESVRAEAKRGKPKRAMNRLGIAGIAAAAVLVCVLIPIGAGLLGGGNGGANNALPYMAAGESGLYGTGAADVAVPQEAPRTEEMRSDDMAPMPMPEMALYDEMAEAEKYDTGNAKGVSPQAATSGTAHGLKLIRSGYVTLETRSFDEDLANLQALVANYEGYIEGSSVSGIPYDADPNSYGRWANLSVRVPSASLDAFLLDAKGVGNLLDSSINAQDITASYQDTELRLQSLRTQHTRLNELLAQAETVEDLIQIETKLSDVQYEIDSLTGTLRDWDSRVDYSSVNISVNEVKTYKLTDNVDPTLGERISQGFTKGVHDFAMGAQNFLVYLVSALPVILLIAVLAAAAFFLTRHMIRRRKGKPHGDADPPEFNGQP